MEINNKDENDIGNDDNVNVGVMKYCDIMNNIWVLAAAGIICSHTSSLVHQA